MKTFSNSALAALVAMLGVAQSAPAVDATAPTVDVTREECSGSTCTAHLLTLPLDYNTTLSEPASSLYLTGVNNPSGGIIDINKIECSYAYKGQTEIPPIFTNKAAAYIGQDSVELEYILCSYNRATPGRI